ncbi:MAG: hypothetical protein ABI614_05890 [Planctomycetota bacterium]
MTNTNTKLGKRLTILAIVMLPVCAFAGWFAPQPFFKAWLAAAMLPWSVSIGSLTLMLIVCLTGGRWGRAAWPWLATSARLMPLVALLFVPWLLGIKTIYPWANSDILSQFDETENRQWLFQIPFYAGRTVCYFAVWSVLSCMVAGWPWSRRTFLETDELQPPRILGGQAAAGLGLIAILLTVTWAGIDWVMSFDPFFTSTLFGAMIGIGAMLSAMSATVAAVCFWKPLHGAATDDKTIGDLSNLLLAFLMLWAYFSFAHFLIMWSGDLPIEASFYAARTAGVWGWIAPLLSIGGFVVPFFCLLSYDFKRSPRKVGTLALCLLVVRLVELWWMVLPTAGGGAYAGLHWSVVPTAVAVIAIYSLALSWMMRRAERHQGWETTR